jgi:hypothetical protein
MSVKIFDMHAIQTDVLFNTNNRTNNGRIRQKSSAATRLHSIPTLPYAAHATAVVSTTTMATGTTTLTTSMETVDGSELCHYPHRALV